MLLIIPKVTFVKVSLEKIFMAADLRSFNILSVIQRGCRGGLGPSLIISNCSSTISRSSSNAV